MKKAIMAAWIVDAFVAIGAATYVFSWRAGLMALVSFVAGYFISAMAGEE